jgi:hypothetical protein
MDFFYIKANNKLISIISKKLIYIYANFLHKSNTLGQRLCTQYLIMNATGRPSGIQSPDIFYNH